MSRKASSTPDLAAWKLQAEHTATAFDLLALAASTSPHLRHLANPPTLEAAEAADAPTAARAQAQAALPPLTHVARTLQEMAGAPIYDPPRVDAALRQQLRETRALVEDTRRMLEHSAESRPGGRALRGTAHSPDDPGFLLRDYVPRLERAVGALEHLSARLPRAPGVEPAASGVSPAASLLVAEADPAGHVDQTSPTSPTSPTTGAGGKRPRA